MQIAAPDLLRVAAALVARQDAQYTEPPVTLDDAERKDADRAIALISASGDIVDVIAALETCGYNVTPPHGDRPARDYQ